MKSSNCSSSGLDEEEDPVQELCTANGINYEKLKKGQSSKKIHTLEMFFSGFPRISGMELFPGLQVLTLIGQEIEVLQNLDCLPHLTELCVSECSLKELSGIDKCTNLKKVYFYDNHISKIENLSSLTRLTVLWLNSNNIQAIEGLESLAQLTDLNLASNKITSIGDTLQRNTHLEVLDLSANRIGSFKDLTNLVHLPHLKSLSLKDPTYGPNPVSLLCNYATHLLFHLPKLTRLDSYDVDNKALKELAEATVSKKKMYYNMRVKTLHRNKADLLSKLFQEKEDLQSTPHSHIAVLVACIKEIEKEQENAFHCSFEEAHNPDNEKDEGKESDGSGEDDDCAKKLVAKPSFTELNDQYEIKKQALANRIAKWEKQSTEIEQCYQESCQQVKSVSDMTVQRLLLELDTGGNVRFEDGKSSDAWYKSCQDLVTSRFCAGDYMDRGITGIKVHRITRVHNRILRTRFDEKLDQVLDKDSIIDLTKGRSHKKLLEYLFFMWEPDALNGENEPITVLENGFRQPSVYEDAGLDGGVPLANSVGISDKPRLEHVTKLAKQRGSVDPYPYRHGQLIVAKVFVGRAVPARAAPVKITERAYPCADSVFRPRSHEVCQSRNVLGITKPGNQCECSSRQCSWFVFDQELVLPEYVVDFEYVTKLKPKSPYIYYYGDPVRTVGATTAGCGTTEGQDSEDDDVINMDPVVKPRPRMVALTEELLLRHCRVEALQQITVLNLHGNGLNRLKFINSMTALKRLIVSFNELTRLEDVNHMLFLEHLDASFNKLTTLEGVKGCSRLGYLDVSWNQLQYTREELGMMRKHLITLTYLDTRHNPWQKTETLRMRALGRLKNLEFLDGKPVTDEEMATALRMAAASRISSFAILAHARTDQVKPRALSLRSTAEIILASSHNKPARPLDDDSQWFVKVTAVNLDNQHLGKLSNLEKLVHLRWASFNNNDLTKIEGFESCSSLEELSLEGNCISKFEGLVRNPKLKWLNLSSNNLTILDTGMLERLPELRYLSLENNNITCLKGLQHAVELQELYLGNNLLANIREIFSLKPIPMLVILDLYGNPLVENTANYRLFVIFHLTTLKALDGLAVESNEGNVAKDAFGGRMTTDFIAERLGHSNFIELRELDFPHCSLRTVDLGSGEMFLNLRSVNLEHNSLTSFGSLINLVNLKVLCLNHNHIESIVTKPKATSPANAGKRSGEPGNDYANPEMFNPVLTNLEVLHLGYNSIPSISGLQLSRLPNLKALFLQGNEITKVDGLEGLQDLRELVLDRNKIKCISEYSFINQWNLIELHIEENRLKELSNLDHLQNLQRLYLGMNRIQDLSQFEKLESLSNLIELSVINNAVTRRLLHRPMLVFRMPSLLCIDGIPVSSDERTKSEMYFLDQQGGMQPSNTETLPGIVTARGSHGAPLRVTTMQLSNAERNWSGTKQEFINNSTSQAEVKGRRRPVALRGASSHSLQAMSTSDSYGNRSFSNSNLPGGQNSSWPTSGSQSLTFIPTSSSSYQFNNGDTQIDRNAKSNRHR
ncbi:leucine-rich repeat-containing protein 9 isoform X2 [Nematostella vectensis]|uniref:leucine-rich repeat-containing protein 9 isoform X2 n=1 Tax=Nematostella vectensis TaxID=45351 RepID=UPI002077765B|nr:leucine-rich repeat-containing protein 9 isoform X2 [Nematostella vectensis]